MQWNTISHISPSIPFPTPSFQLDQLLERSGLGLAFDEMYSLSDEHLIELKTKIFFLVGVGIPYDIGPTAYRDIVLEHRFAEHDTTRVEALLQQLKIERAKWMPELLNRRTGVYGYSEEALGNDFVVVAIRTAVRELICECEKKLRKHAR